MALRWVGDDGPLVVLAEAHAEDWLAIWREVAEGDPDDAVEEIRGRRLIVDDDFDSPVTDYARLCLQLEEQGAVVLVSYRGGVALALGTTGHQAAVLPTTDGVVIAKWIYAPSHEHAEATLTQVHELTEWVDSGLTWECPPGGARLHAAAARGDEDEHKTLRFELPPGPYRVATADLAPDAETLFELFALRAAP
jgi:hypothetical protein